MARTERKGRWHFWQPLHGKAGNPTTRKSCPACWWVRDRLQGPCSGGFVSWFHPGTVHDEVPPFFAARLRARSILRG